MKKSSHWNTRNLRWIGSIVLVAAMAACGGGDDSIAPPSTIPPAVSPPLDEPPVIDPINNANAVDDVFPAVLSTSGGNTAPVQMNDTVTIDGTSTAAVLGTNSTIAAVTRTSAAPAVGSITLNTSTGVITVASGTSAGAYAFTYQLCRTAPSQTICDVATASGTVADTAPPSDVVTTADILACPSAPNLITATNWTTCLVGKRIVGRDTLITSQVCEMRFLANGSVEYTHNGVTYTPGVAGPAFDGLYQNTTSDQFVRLLLGSLNFARDFNLTRNQLTSMSLNIDLNGADTMRVQYSTIGSGTTDLNCSLTNL